MIPRLNEPTRTPHGPLTEALGRPISPDDRLEDLVVAHWSGLDDHTVPQSPETWSTLQWAEHLEAPRRRHPFAASPNNDRRAILHLDVRLHPDDRNLTGHEWAEVAHRFARIAGIESSDKELGCRWVAIHAQPGRLDLIASLIGHHGAWHTPSGDILRRLWDEARRIEQDLHLIPVRAGTTPRPAVPTASAAFASVLTRLADEHVGPLSTVRGLVEHTAYRMARQPDVAATDTAHRLELIARRLHDIQRDLDTVAVRLSVPRGAAVPPVVHHTAYRTP
ncbi:relaxase/mobilization nuclease [Streptomyces buecherae]|uniref:relaxase/mobilization nuclease n=1 Tax=Streptomyces buecherae TaxID=2763006 RepID=UPI001C258218|nr:relaxase/mobilization nuclease [Streptomyces buecherae]